MNRMLWFLLLVVVLGGCQAGSEPMGLKAKAVTEAAWSTMEKPIEANPTIPVDGPATVYVLQDGQVRALIQWHLDTPGSIVVPLKEVDTGGRPLAWGVTGRDISKEPRDKRFETCCVVCQNALDRTGPTTSGREPCCPKEK